MLLFFLFCFFSLLILVFILFFLIVFCPRCSCSYSLSSSPPPHIYSFTLSSNLNIIYITTIKFPSLLLYLLSVIIEMNSPLTHSVSGFFFCGVFYQWLDLESSFWEVWRTRDAPLTRRSSQVSV